MTADDVPQYHELLWPTLQAVTELGGSASIGEITETVIKRQGFGSAQQALLHNRGPETEIGYRLGRARSHLKGMRLLTNTARGVWGLTDEGGALFADPATTDSQRRERIHELWQAYLVERRMARKARPSQNAADPDAAQLTLKPGSKELLDQLTDTRPDAFQQPIQQLLREGQFDGASSTGQGSDGAILNVDLPDCLNGSRPDDVPQPPGNKPAREHRLWPLEILIVVLMLIAGVSTFLGIQWRPTSILDASSVVKNALSSPPVIGEMDLSTSIPVPARATLIVEAKHLLLPSGSRGMLVLSFNIPRATVLHWALRVWATQGSAPQIIANPQPSGTHVTSLSYEGGTQETTYYNPDGSTTEGNYESYMVSGTSAGPSNSYTLSSANPPASLTTLLTDNSAAQAFLPLKWKGAGIVDATNLAASVQAPDLISEKLTLEAYDSLKPPPIPLSWRSAAQPFHWQIVALTSEPVQEVYGPLAAYNDGFDWFFNDTSSGGEQVEFYGANTFAGDVLSNSSFRSGLAFGVAGTAIVAALQAGATLLFERRRRDKNAASKRTN